MIPFIKVMYESEDITNYVKDLQVALSSDVSKSTASITLKNSNKKLNGIGFDLDGDVTIYLDTNNAITTQDPIITSVINGIDYTEDGKKNEIKLSCVDKTYVLLSKLWGKHYPESDGLNASDIIINVINQINDNFDEGDKITTTSVATTKFSGDAFPTGVTMTKVWKPIYEWIKDLSAPEYTGEDRNYVFHMDENNDLHWTYPSQKLDIYLDGDITDSDTTIDVDSTSTYPSIGRIQIEDEEISYTGKTGTSFTGCTRGFNNTIATSHSSGTLVSALVFEDGKKYIGKLKISKTNDQGVNFIIYNAGPTPEGFEYLWYQFDEGNADKEFRMVKKEWKDIGQNMKTDEYNKDPTKWDTRESGYPNAYPWATSWGVSTANDSAYFDAFIAEMVKRATSRAQALFSSVGEAKFKGDIDMKGNIGFRINDMCTVLSNENDLDLKLRVKEIRYQFGKQGLSMNVTLGEDDAAIN